MDADTRMLIREVTGAIVQAINRVATGLNDIAKAQASQAAVEEAALTSDQRSLVPNRLRSTGSGR